MAVTLDSLRKTVKKNKGRSQAMAWLADMERASGDYDAALKTIDSALAASPSDVPAMLVRAKILSGKQDFAGSISEYKKVLAKDPFCLSAHKRMGESYDKLGKVAERNACFRRVHDMDPLDSFWKDEYDVLSEEEQANLAPPPMDESSFTMDVADETENTEVQEDNVFANLAASLSNTDEEDNSSMDALRNSLDSASDDFSKNAAGSEASGFDDQVLNSSEVTSAISGLLGDSDDFDIASSAKKAGTAAAAATAASLFSNFVDDGENETLDEEPKFEEPGQKKNSDGAEEQKKFSIDDLDEPLETKDIASDVNDALSSLLDDNLSEDASAGTASAAAEQAEPLAVENSEPEKPTESLGLHEEESLGGLFESFAKTDIPAEEPAVEELAEKSEIPSQHMDFLDDNSGAENTVSDKFSLDDEPKAADAETNVDDAFASLLGEDELPDEKTLSETSAPEKSLEESVEDSFGNLFEKSADADFSMDGGLADTAPSTEPIPSESPAEEESFGGLFEKSADADFSMDEASTNLSSDSETLSTTDAPEHALEKAPEFVPTETAEIEQAEGLVPMSRMSFSEDEAPSKTDDDFVLNLDEDTPSETPSATETASLSATKPVQAVADAPVELAEKAPATEESAVEEVDDAFDALFGNEASEEKADAEVLPASTTAAETAPVEKAPAAPVDLAVPAENAPAAPADKDDVVKEMGGAFASIFGEEDDAALPEEKSDALSSSFSAPSPTEANNLFATGNEKIADVPATEQLSQEATGAEIEESSVKEEAKGGISESFDSIFGTDDDLPEEKKTFEEPAMEQVAKADVSATSVASATVAEQAPSAELDSIDSEVSNAFKGLFDEDDSLSEVDEPSNKGVDYLMSGDSDDEVSASLVNNVEAPLSRGAADLDDSLNTRTLADIYMEQGVYNKALEIYSDLAKKNPDNAEIKSRLEEIEKLCREKFGEV